MKLILLLITLSLSLFHNVQGQIINRPLKTLTGRVISETAKISLSGAILLLKKSGTQCITNKKGEFSIQLKTDNDTLLVKYLGYKSKTLIISDQQNPLLIILQKGNSKLHEIIVSTGYQKIPEERATGSFDFIDQNLIDQQVGTDILSRLESIANGVMVDRSTNSDRMMIRGLSTIRGPKKPLIILNNFPYEGDISNINPNDVKSITILKDAAAASIWGTRAGNGVIVINTKDGSYNKPISIEVNTNITIGQKPDLSYLRIMSSQDFINVEKYLFSKGYYNSIENSSSYPPLSPAVELLIAERDGKISQSEMDEGIKSLANHSVYSDMNQYLYQEAVKQQYAISMKGGSLKNAWILSTGYDRNISDLDAKYNRLNLHLENKYKPITNLEIKAGLYITKTNTQEGKPTYNDIKTSSGSLPPYTRLADNNGNPIPFYMDYRQTYIDTAGDGKLLDWKYYPLEDYQYISNKVNTLDLLGNINIKYSFLNYFSGEISCQYEQQQSNNQILHGQKSYYTRNLINSFTNIDPLSGTVIHNLPEGAILDLSRSTLISQSVRGQINFNKSWARNFITAIAGGEIRQNGQTGDTYRTYGYDKNLLTSVNVDYTHTYPLYVNGIESFIPNINSFTGTINRYISLYANAAYTFKNKYTISASGRRDASNLFGVSINDKWVPLWSTGLSWTISHEPFYKSNILPYLKIRATFGYSGNVDNGQAAVTTIGYLFTSPYTKSPMATFTNYSNPDLRWEKVGMLNLGIDFRSKNNRITGSLEYYHKRGIDLLGPAPLDYTAGLSTDVIIKNVAEMKAGGMDIQLNSLNINGLFKWSTQLNFSLYKDKVSDYYLSSNTASNFVGIVPDISGIIGKPVYSMYSYRWAGLGPATGDPRGYLDNKVSEDYSAIMYSATLNDLVFDGPVLPVVYGTLGNTFSWKNLSLVIQLSYKTGFYFRREGINYAKLFAGNSTRDFSKRWQEPGDEKFTQVPSLAYPNSRSRDAFYAGSDVLIDKGDYVRLQYLNLNYTFNRTDFSKFPFRQCELYLYASNLGVLWKANKDNIDPEYLRDALPPPANFALGVKIEIGK